MSFKEITREMASCLMLKSYNCDNSNYSILIIALFYLRIQYQKTLYILVPSKYAELLFKDDAGENALNQHFLPFVPYAFE